VKVRPPIVSVALRACVFGFAAALKLTVPAPLPLEPLVIVNHVSLLDAVHAQPFGPPTLVDPDPPAADTDWLPGDNVKVHDAAACDTLYVCPAIVTVPARGVVLGFAAMLNVVDPLPDPLEPPVSVIHDALLVEVHAQPVSVVTAAEPVAAPAPTA
jgi:hypothetical protein